MPNLEQFGFIAKFPLSIVFNWALQLVAQSFHFNLSRFLQLSSHWLPKASSSNQDLLQLYCILLLCNPYSKALRHQPAPRPLNSRLWSVLPACNPWKIGMLLTGRSVCQVVCVGLSHYAKCQTWWHQDEGHILLLQYLTEKLKLTGLTQPCFLY